MMEFGVPWESFYLDAKKSVEQIVVSHKPTSKLISKAINKYYKWIEVEPGQWEKKIHLQTAPASDGKFWVAARQPLFRQPLGKIFIAEYKKRVDFKTVLETQMQFFHRKNNEWNTEDWRIAKSVIRKQIDSLIVNFNGDEKVILKFLENNPIKDAGGNILTTFDLLQFKKYASKKVPVDASFTKDKIEKMPYAHLGKNWLTNLLKQHLSIYNDNPKLAFKGEALEMFYKKAPTRINKVTRKEGGGKIEKDNKLFNGDAGVNQYFVVEIKRIVNKKTGEEIIKRKYETPDFLQCIERLAKGLPIHDADPDSQYIILSPGDLVYVPDDNEIVDTIDWNNKNKITDKVYIMKSSNNGQCFFIPNVISRPIIDAVELGDGNKSERAWNKKMIKQNFIKLKVDRLGNVSPY